ncbi:MAG: 2Fe-2S iron-sulfur cluster-binding protein [Acidimicrobiia bacterium]|nr:MAG: 2Fe-2S iron-sulfur cluster-binding protein [Acidimicrobiia bacterium]
MTDTVQITIDGVDVRAPADATILEAAAKQGTEVPTLCYLETLTAANACRLCVVEVAGARVLAPACSRQVEEGMVIKTRSARVDRARRMVLELLVSSVDLSLAPELLELADEYGAEPGRFGDAGATVEHPVNTDNGLYVQDLSKCVLCYRCVSACGDDAQHTYAITVTDRGFGAAISTEFGVALPDSACVFCGNCVAVCPTGALIVTTEYDMRQAGAWDEGAQTVTRTICAYCGVGCNLDVHVQEGEIVKVTSPFDHDVTAGNLCIKGRFGWSHVSGPASPA